MMEYKGYVGTVELDPDAKVFSGQVIGTRDIITFEGTTAEQVLRAFHDSVDDYLDFCKSRGEKPEKPYSGKFVVRTAPETHRLVSVLAKAHGQSLNAFVNERLTSGGAELGELLRRQQTAQDKSLAQIKRHSGGGPHTGNLRRREPRRQAAVASDKYRGKTR
jgi:predicted HicB family RNase H-like nuclease